jgi:hypothetical protein
MDDKCWGRAIIFEGGDFTVCGGPKTLSFRGAGFAEESLFLGFPNPERFLTEFTPAPTGVRNDTMNYFFRFLKILRFALLWPRRFAGFAAAASSRRRAAAHPGLFT